MREIPLTRGKVAIVDDEDYERVTSFRWSATKNAVSDTWYAKRNKSENCSYALLHRFILNAPLGCEIDHINLDGLDCRKSNLRFATRQQNAANVPVRKQANKVSRFKGVGWNKNGYWAASVKVNGKEKSSYWPTEHEAAMAYNRMAHEAFGEFARLNSVNGLIVALPCNIPGCEEPRINIMKRQKRFCAEHSLIPDWKRSEIRKRLLG